MVNDRRADNQRYRAPVIAELERRGLVVQSQGFLESVPGFLVTLTRVLGHRADLLFSSNLKSNILVLAFGRGQTLILLNGLGRLRQRRWFRALFLLLLRNRKAVEIVVQSYADFRYLRRQRLTVPLHWVPGSGGSMKHTGDPGVAVLVQRDNKIALVAADLKSLFDTHRGTIELVVVGCRDQRRLAAILPVPHRSTGIIPTSDIFRDGGIFIQPSGYGDGFPHTLADAIISGMEIWISNRAALRSGVSRLGARLIPLAPGWSRLVEREGPAAAVSVPTIAARMADLCEAGIARAGRQT
jgi:hypothetical protein